MYLGAGGSGHAVLFLLALVLVRVLQGNRSDREVATLLPVSVSSHPLRGMRDLVWEGIGRQGGKGFRSRSHFPEVEVGGRVGVSTAPSPRAEARWTGGWLSQVGAVLEQSAGLKAGRARCQDPARCQVWRRRRRKPAAPITSRLPARQCAGTSQAPFHSCLSVAL